MSASASGRTISRTLGPREDSRLYLGPWRPGNWILAVGIQAAITLPFLRLGQLQGIRQLRDAVPDCFRELETLVDCQSKDLGNADGLHRSNLSSPRAVSKSRPNVTSNG